MKLVVFQHIDCEHPAAFRRYLAEAGVSWDAVELDQGDDIPVLASYDMLWVMGGPMDVWDVDDYPWLIPEKEAIRDWVLTTRKPFLGVCLGHQLLADVLGGACGRMDAPEVGICDVSLTSHGRRDPVFGGLPATHNCLQWHSVEVARHPPDAIVLATSDICPCQAIRVRDGAYGIQYHVEVEDDTVAEWGRVPAYESALEKVRGPGALKSLEADLAAHANDMAHVSRALYDGFMSIARK